MLLSGLLLLPDLHLEELLFDLVEISELVYGFV